MQTSTKIFIGLAVTSAAVCWAMTTKNEVVESVVFPLKVKLGLAEYKATGIVANDTGKTAFIGHAKKQLENALMFDNRRFPNVIGMGTIKSKGNDAIEIALLEGRNHDNVLSLFPNRTYLGIPIVFREMGQAVIQ